MKKLLCFMLTFMLSMSAFATMSVSAYNDLDTVITDIVQPRYSYTSSVSTDLYINNGKAACTSTVTGMSTVTKIVATQYLEKKTLFGGWKEVDHWDKTVNGDYLYMCNSKDNLSSGTYRVRTVATVYSGTDYEIVEDISKSNV